MPPRLLPRALLAVGAAELLLGLVMALAPRTFQADVGPFGAENPHYVRDLATWTLALGAVTLLAARRRSWRVPVLALTLVQSALHALNHAWDVGQADPGWAGPANLVALLAATALAGLLLRAALRDRER